jgi:hypothetical protein
MLKRGSGERRTEEEIIISCLPTTDETQLPIPQPPGLFTLTLALASFSALKKKGLKRGANMNSKTLSKLER